MRARFTSREGASAALNQWAEFSAHYGTEKEWFLDDGRNAKFMTNVAKALLRMEARA